MAANRRAFRWTVWDPEALPAPEPMIEAHGSMRWRIKSYRVFISHRYRRSAEYRRLVALLRRAQSRDRTWRWEDVSIPVGAKYISKAELKQTGTYDKKIRNRLKSAHIVLHIAHDDWMDNDGSMYRELTEATLRDDGGRTPIVDVLPRGARRNRRLKLSTVTVPWHPVAIIRAVRTYSRPVTANELVFRQDERVERRRIAAAIAANSGSLRRAADDLGVSLSTLRWNKMRYLID